MTMHYHGTPISPMSVLATLAGRNFCVSYAAPADVERCHEIGQSVMLDNGAFTFWKQGGKPDWEGYESWVERWTRHPNTWAVIPDVIEGSEEDNDRFIDQWPHSLALCAAPVWHMHESLDRLSRLCEDWPRVCIGSSAQFAVLQTDQWHRRMDQAFNEVWEPGLWLHMLRGMALVDGPYPFASVDSTDVGRNHNRNGNTAEDMAKRWDRLQCPADWVPREQMELA